MGYTTCAMGRNPRSIYSANGNIIVNDFLKYVHTLKSGKKEGFTGYMSSLKKRSRYLLTIRPKLSTNSVFFSDTRALPIKGGFFLICCATELFRSKSKIISRCRSKINSICISAVKKTRKGFEHGSKFRIETNQSKK